MKIIIKIIVYHSQPSQSNFIL